MHIHVHVVLKKKRNENCLLQTQYLMRINPQTQLDSISMVKYILSASDTVTKGRVVVWVRVLVFGWVQA